ncbi:hypothetical protein [Parasutterella excrementihominis]|uniref:hypothetical protein n=1 Tax=Parasutterella excrementihominis TaxID=487175 RepID=UPI003A8D82C4
MHIFEEASPTIIGQMVTPKNIGDFFLESSYYFYCWDDLIKNLRGNFLCADAVMDDDYNLIDTNENRYLSI